MEEEGEIALETLLEQFAADQAVESASLEVTDQQVGALLDFVTTHREAARRTETRSTRPRGVVQKVTLRGLGTHSQMLLGRVLLSELSTGR